MLLINPDNPWKYRVKQTSLLKKLLEKGIFYLTTRDWDPNMGWKYTKNYFFGFNFHLSYIYTWVDLICWTCLVFLKPPGWPVLAFCAEDLPKENILRCIICVIKRRIPLQGTPTHRCFCEWMCLILNFRSSPKFSKILPMMKYCNSMSVMMHF